MYVKINFIKRYHIHRALETVEKMGIKLTRVDDRLIHGQVATSWIRSHDINVIVVVDNNLSTDKSQIAILRMSAPSSVKVYVMDEDKFLEKFNAGILDKYNVMLVFENVFTPLHLVEKGMKLETLNIGGVRFKDGRKQFAKQLSLSPEEVEAVHQLFDHNVKLEMKQLASDSSGDVMGLITGGK